MVSKAIKPPPGGGSTKEEEVMKKYLMILALPLLALPLSSVSAMAAKYRYPSNLNIQADFQNMHPDAKGLVFYCYLFRDSSHAATSFLSIPKDGALKGIIGINMPRLGGFSGRESKQPKLRVSCDWSIQGPSGKEVGASENVNAPIWARAKKGTLSSTSFDIWVVGKKVQ